MSKARIKVCLSYRTGYVHPDKGVRTSFRNPQFYGGEIEKCDFVITDNKTIAENYSKAKVELIKGISDVVETEEEIERNEDLLKVLNERYGKMPKDACKAIIEDQKLQIEDGAPIANLRKVIIDHVYFVELAEFKRTTASTSDWPVTN